MTVDSGVSRRVLGAFVMSVTLVSSRDAEADHLATVSSFSVASFSVPRVCICLDARSRLMSMIRSSGVWGVSLLDGGAAELARFFAQRGRPPGAGLHQIPYTRGPRTGVVLLRQAVAALECQTVGELDEGDRVLFLGMPVWMSAPSHDYAGTGDPLCHFRGGLYRAAPSCGHKAGFIAGQQAANLPLHRLECDRDEGNFL